MEVGQKPFTQKKPQQLVYLELGSGNGGMLLSISEEGFRFRAVSPVRPDGPMPFAFSLDGINRLEGSGEVESLEDDGKSGGLRFSEVSDDFRAKLEKWLSEDSSSDAPGREVTPAAATPLDTMEKIRQEIRAGSSVSRHPRTETPEPTPAATSLPFKRQVAEKKSGPGAPARKIPQPIITEHPVPEVPVAETPVTDQPVANKTVAGRPSFERPVIERIIPEPSPIPPFSERLPEPQEPPNAASRLFPLPSPSVPETEKPAALASAFLKLARETKSPAATTMAPAGPPVSGAPVTPKLPAAPASRMASSKLFIPVAPPASVANVPLDESAEKEQPRRYVPALDVSLDVAWENAKLSSPGEPPHLSRAAAGGIIIIALAVILGALTFNFRQEIGAIFIQMGQRISGDNRADAPAQGATPENQAGDAQNATQTSPPPESQSRNATANSGNASKPSSASPKANEGSATPTSNSASRKTDATTGTKSGGTAADGAQKESSATVPAATKTQENPAAQYATDGAAKTTTPVDSGTGQEEFDAAREILRGKNRTVELSRAVELLWSAVKKGNVPAEVTLGDLYRRGDGVEKSCDQARVLLVAASKKGSADARQHLEQMAEQGCQ